MPELQVIAGRRGVATTVTIRQTQLDDLRDELAALVAEGRELADRIVAVSRRAERNLSRGWSAAGDLDELERLGLRHQARMASAGAAARVGAICPDGQTERHVGCGRAA